MADNEDYNEADEIDENQIIFQQGDGVIEAVRNGEVIGWVMASDGPGSKASKPDTPPMPSKDSYAIDSVDRAALKLMSRCMGDTDTMQRQLSQAYHHGTRDERKAALMLTVIAGHAALDGGPGSGNHGHKGRPGLVGGSGKGGSSGAASPSGSGKPGNTGSPGNSFSGTAAPNAHFTTRAGSGTINGSTHSGGTSGQSGSHTSRTASPSSPSGSGSSTLSLAISRKRLTEGINDILGRFDSGEIDDQQAHDEIRPLLEELGPYSMITVPMGDWYVDDQQYKKDVDGTYWHAEKAPGASKYHVTDKYDYGDAIAWDFTQGKKECRPYFNTVARSREDNEAARQRREAANWRKQKNPWQGDDGIDFMEKRTIRLQKSDLDYAGEGTRVKASNGDTYVKELTGYNFKNHDDFIGTPVYSWRNERTDKYVKNSAQLGNPTFEGDFFDTHFGLNGVSAEACAATREAYKAMPDKLREVYDDTFRKITFKSQEMEVKRNSRITSACCDAGGDVYLDRTCSSFDVFHECAHSFDNGAINKQVFNYHDEHGDHYIGVYSASQNIDDIMGVWSSDKQKEDFESMSKVLGIPSDGKGYFEDDSREACEDRYKKYYKPFIKQYEHIDKDKEDKLGFTPFHAVSDALSALTRNGMDEVIVEAGHRTEYWYNWHQSVYQGNLVNYTPISSEYWANYCALRATGCKDTLDLLKQVTPNRYAACEQTFKEAFGE